jgi:DNA invertase Pin-like site-specific DNA recombinase
MANGVKFGRKRKLSDYQRAEAIKRRAAGETLTAIATSYGVHVSTISRLEPRRVFTPRIQNNSGLAQGPAARTWSILAVMMVVR